MLRGNKNFFWEDEQKKAYQQLKNHLHSLPTLARPVLGKNLYLYAAASQTTVSATIVREEGNVQQPICYVSRILLDVKTRYSLIEKTACAVVVAARKLKPYFNALQVIVLTDLPLEKFLDKIESSGRLAKWAVELMDTVSSIKQKLISKDKPWLTYCRMHAQP